MADFAKAVAMALGGKSGSKGGGWGGSFAKALEARKKKKELEAAGGVPQKEERVVSDSLAPQEEKSEPKKMEFKPVESPRFEMKSLSNKEDDFEERRRRRHAKYLE